MEAAHLILIAVYDDGLLITIDGKQYFYHMNFINQLNMAMELIEKTKQSMKRD